MLARESNRFTVFPLFYPFLLHHIMSVNIESALETFPTPFGATKRPQNTGQWARVRAKKQRNFGREWGIRLEPPVL